MSTLSNKIEELQKQIAENKDELSVLTKKMIENEDDETLPPQVDDLNTKIEKSEARLKSLKNTEQTLAERAKAAPAIVTSTGKADDQKDLWAKKAVCAFLAHAERKSIEQVREERYATNKALAAVMTKTAVPEATTFTPGWAQELVQQDVRGFIDLLTPTSVAAALASRAMALSFDGFDSVRIPRRKPRVAGQTLGGAFVGEGGAIPLGRMAVGAEILSRYKMGVISTFTKELAQRSTPQIEAVLRAAIQDDMSMSLDAAFMDGSAAVAGIRPAGILNGVTATAGTAGGGVDAVIADIKAAISALSAAGLGTRPVLLVNSQDALSVGLMQTALGEFLFRDEMNGGRMLGIEVIKSLNVTKGQAIVVDAAALATAFDGTEFDVSDVATVVEADADGTAPTHATGAAGAVGTAGQVPRDGGIPVSGGSGAAAAGATARSLWQTWSVGVRAIQPVSWGFMQPGATVHLSALTW